MINFINKNIPIYLVSELQKFDFDESDFKKINKLHLSSFDLGNNFLSNSLKDLNVFPNLTKLELSKYIINKDNINILENSKIDDYTFYNCDFKDKINISGRNIRIISCKDITNIDFTKFISVTIQNTDISNLKFDNIKNIELLNIKLNEDDINYLNNLSANISLVECKFKGKIGKNIKIINKRLLLGGKI